MREIREISHGPFCFKRIAPKKKAIAHRNTRAIFLNKFCGLFFGGREEFSGLTFEVTTEDDNSGISTGIPEGAP